MKNPLDEHMKIIQELNDRKLRVDSALLPSNFGREGLIEQHLREGTVTADNAAKVSREMLRDLNNPVTSLREQAIAKLELINQSRARGLSALTDFNRDAALTRRELYDHTLGILKEKDWMPAGIVIKDPLEKIAHIGTINAAEHFGKINNYHPSEAQVTSTLGVTSKNDYLRGLGVVSVEDDRLGSLGFLQDYRKAFTDYSVEMERRVKGLSDNFRQLEITGRHWHSVLGRIDESKDLFYRRAVIESVANLQLNSELIFDSLRARDYLDKFPELSRNMFSVTDQYGRFARRTANRIERTLDKHEKEILNDSLKIADEQLASTAETISQTVTALEIDESTDTTIESEVLETNFFVVTSAAFRAEMSRKSTVKESKYELLRMIQDEANICVKLLVSCNNAAMIKNGNEIFKVTSSLLDSCANLPVVVADSEESFSTFVNHLHRIIYEAAGSDNLRYNLDCGGFLPVADFTIVFVIKDLRNKRYFHLQKGTEAENKKAWSAISNAFNFLGRKEYPIKPLHFLKMQAAALKKTRQFMERLLNAIVSDDEEGTN